MAIQNEGAMRYAVRVSANEGAKVGRIVFGDIAVQIVKAKHNVIKLPMPVLHLDGRDCTPVVRDLHVHTGLIPECVKKYFLTIGSLAERLHIHIFSRLRAPGKRKRTQERGQGECASTCLAERTRFLILAWHHLNV